MKTILLLILTVNLSACALFKKEEQKPRWDSYPPTESELEKFRKDDELKKAIDFLDKETMTLTEKNTQREYLFLKETHSRPDIGGTVRGYFQNEYYNDIFNEKVLEYCNSYNLSGYEIIKQYMDREFISYGSYHYFREAIFICKDDVK